MLTEEKLLSKQFLAQRDRIDGLVESLQIDLVFYSVFENILDGEECLPEGISALDFLIYVNQLCKGHLSALREAWHTAEELYDRMGERAKI